MTFGDCVKLAFAATTPLMYKVFVDNETVVAMCVQVLRLSEAVETSDWYFPLLKVVNAMVPENQFKRKSSQLTFATPQEMSEP